MHRPIIILGGMGPQASLTLHALLIEGSRKFHSGQGHEYPSIVHFSLPIVDFISDPTKQLAAVTIISQLEDTITRLNPKCIALACNTAHLLIPDIAVLKKPEFLSLLDCVVVECNTRGYQAVGLLASPHTIQSKLYEKLLTANHVTTMLPDDTLQDKLELLIRDTIAGTAQPAQILEIEQACNKQFSDKSDALILGCTELPLSLSNASFSLPVVDCLEIYARSILEEYYLN